MLLNQKKPLPQNLNQKKRSVRYPSTHHLIGTSETRPPNYTRWFGVFRKKIECKHFNFTPKSGKHRYNTGPTHKRETYNTSLPTMHTCADSPFSPLHLDSACQPNTPLFLSHHAPKRPLSLSHNQQGRQRPKKKGSESFSTKKRNSC